VFGYVKVFQLEPVRVRALNNDGRYLSVRLSVDLVPDPKSRTEGSSKLKIGRREAVTRDHI